MLYVKLKFKIAGGGASEFTMDDSENSGDEVGSTVEVLARDLERDRRRDLERDFLRDRSRDRERDQIRDAKRDAERDAVRDEERDSVRDRERDAIRDQERDAAKEAVETRDGEEKNTPELTVEKVMEVFKRISSVNTPEINSNLAIPFKKEPVNDSSKFKEEYSVAKNDLRKTTGGKGKGSYQEEKKRKLSLPFPWPKASASEEGGWLWVQIAEKIACPRRLLSIETFVRGDFCSSSLYQLYKIIFVLTTLQRFHG